MNLPLLGLLYMQSFVFLMHYQLQLWYISYEYLTDQNSHM